MPIDFAAIADRFREPLRASLARLPLQFEDMDRLAERLERQVADAYHAARWMPLLRFRGDAVGVWVTSPAGAREPDPLALLAVDAARGGQAFRAGMAWVGTAVRQELIIPDLASTAATVLGRLDDATRDVLIVAPSLFDVDRRGVLDLPALAALGVRVAADAGALRPAPGESRGSGTTGGTRRPGAASAPVREWSRDDLNDLVDGIAASSAALVLALPVLGTYVASRARLVSLSGRIRLTDELTRVERGLLDARVDLVTEVRDALDVVTVIAPYLRELEALVVDELDTVLLFAPNAVAGTLNHLRDFVESLNTVTRTWVPILDTVLRMVQAIQNFNLIWPITELMKAAGLTPVYLTIGDLAQEISLAAARAAAATAAVTLHTIAGAIEAADWLSPPLIGPNFAGDARVFRQLGNMFLALAGHDIGPLAVAAPPRRPTPFPDIVAEILPPALDTALATFAEGATNAVRIAMADAIRQGARLADDLDATIGDLAREARTGLGGIDLAAAARNADRWTTETFGPEQERQRREAAERAERAAGDPLITYFTSTGFSLSGALVGMYIDSLHRFVRRRRVRLQPTSPHVLARHGRLIGVRSPRLTVRAHGRRADRATAAQAAGEIRQGLGRMYVTGRDRVGTARSAERTGAGRG